VRRDESGKVVVKEYMEDFPFRYYLLVKQVEAMGVLIADILAQFI
jgi:midasin (ATPase involved in ribosome maturation)